MTDNLHKGPAPFNPSFRPGIGKAISEAYSEYCEANPNASQEDRKAFYARKYESLTLEYPCIGLENTWQGN